MGNPFYLHEIPVDAPFCDRLVELKELRSYAEAKASVVLYSPRRFGKTSLVKRVQKLLSDRGSISIFADFFGVASVNDASARLAKAVFSVTHRETPLWKKALREIRSFRPVLKPDPEGGLALSVEPSSAGRSGLSLLEETMESLGAFIQKADRPVHVALDEFQEIVALKEALQIEGVMRTHIQRQQASYFFIGSRRRLLLGIFNERQRPFFQSAINYALKPLPTDALGEFIRGQFISAKRRCSRDAAMRIVSLASSHPYYSQKLAFLVCGLVESITEEAIYQAFEKLLGSERPVFEAIVQSLSARQRLLLQALAKEQTQKLMANAYVSKHGLGSIGGLQHSTRLMEEMDLIERDEGTGYWRLVDPVFSVWLRGQAEEKVNDQM